MLNDSANKFRRQIMSSDTALASALLHGDAATFARTADDLAGVRGTNALDLPEAATLLERIILTRAPDSAERWKPLAIRALGAMRYTRSLPALDALLEARSESFFAKDLRAQFNAVLSRMSDSVRLAVNPDSAMTI